jgi:cell division protein FtsN
MMNARQRQRDEGRLGTILAVLGCLGLLTLTFGAGFYSGRVWGRTTSSMIAVQASAVPVPRGSGPGAPASAEPPPLTFYEELTAPLTAASPAATMPKLTTNEPRRASDKLEPSPTRIEDKGAKGDRREGSARKGEAESAAPRFTVQIAAYSVRASAEALRNTMAATGHVAYIVESDGAAGTPRYRVRVGSYATREAAIAAASRLPVAGARYVTSR